MPFYTGRPDTFYGPMRTVEAAGELQFPHLSCLRMFDYLVKSGVAKFVTIKCCGL